MSQQPQLNAFQQAQLEHAAAIIYDSTIEDIRRALETVQATVAKSSETAGEGQSKVVALLLLSISLQSILTTIGRDLQRFGGMPKA